MDAEPPRLASLLGAVVKTLPLSLILLVLAPVQWLALALGWHGIARRLPVVFHRVGLWCLGVRVKQEGARLADGPVLLVGNHVSWLDILILGSLAPVRFVSKDDVAAWPLFGTLARLQRTLFVSRTRRTHSANVARDITQALEKAERVILFPEGTSSDGGQVLPFRSALFGAVIGPQTQAKVQSFALAYVRRDGLPISRGERALLGWYGDLDLVPSLLAIIHGGPLDVAIVLDEPHAADALGPRKQAAKTLEQSVRQRLANRLRAG